MNSSIKKPKTCFVICPIGSPDSETRRRSDDLLDFIIQPVLKDLNVEVKRADLIGAPGDITVQIITELNKSDLIIADLTDKNANVFYELAICHALKKPVIHFIKKGDDVPFDLQQNRVVLYDTTNPRMLEPAQQELKKEMENLINGEHPVTNPVTLAALSINVGNQNDETGNLLLAILNRIENIGAQVTSLRNEINSRMHYPSSEISILAEHNRARKEFLSKRLNDLVSEYKSLKLTGNKDPEIIKETAALNESIKYVKNMLDELDS